MGIIHTNHVSYTASDNFLIFIGIILLFTLAGIIAAAVIKKIQNKNK